MSIETKPSSTPNEEPAPQSNSTEQMTAAELRLQVNPDHKPSIIEKLDTRGKKFAAAVTALGVVLGAGYGGGKVVEAIAQDSQQGTTVTEGPGVDGQGETAAPQQTTEPTSLASPSNIAPLETAAPVTTPVAPPAETSPQSPNVEQVNPGAEFGISKAEYDAIVDSYKIDVATHPTAESALAAFNEKMNLYFNGSNVAEDRTKYYEWMPPAGSNFNPGWNSRAVHLHTAAIEDALFVPGYESTAYSYIPSMEETKSNASGLWGNSVKNNETPYTLNYEFNAIGGIARLANGNFSAFGSATFSDNATDIPSAKKDSRAFFSETYPKQKITAIIEDGQWLIAGYEKY